MECCCGTAFLLGSPAPHQPHITGRHQSCLHHHSLFSRGFLQDFLLSYLKASCVQGANAELILQNTNPGIQFLFLFCTTAVKSVKPLEQSFSCLLGYSNEREQQSKADNIQSTEIKIVSSQDRVLFFPWVRLALTVISRIKLEP